MGARDALARGLAAGFAGTVALTISQRIEMRLTGRPASDLPAQVAEGLLGISIRGRRTRAVAAFGEHWFNNTVSGVGRAVLAAAGLRGAPAAAGTFALYFGGSALLFSRLGLAPPPWRRGARQLAIDVLHAGVWAATTSAAYELLEPRAP
jgi:hypothetical protein